MSTWISARTGVQLPSPPAPKAFGAATPEQGVGGLLLKLPPHAPKDYGLAGQRRILSPNQSRQSVSHLNEAIRSTAAADHSDWRERSYRKRARKRCDPQRMALSSSW